MGLIRSASGMASATALSFRARFGADGECGSPFVCASAASSKGRLDEAGGVLDRSTSCVAAGGGGGDEVGCPFFCVAPGGLRAPGVKKL
jgi:hypothetical protein